MRLINAARELREETGAGLRTIALHTAAERTAMFVREADEALCLDGVGTTPYLDLDALERTLLAADADAAWVGWGFVAERPEFAELCDRLGITFIGPRPAVMRALGDKIAAKLLAEQADVPVAPWSRGPVATAGEARHHAERIGYPLMIKATAGGGGRGIRRVDVPDELEQAFERASSEGAKSFGDPTVFIERVITDARHVEVQIIADGHGTAWALGVRDCSLQRRNQKVIEESHCIAITGEQDAELRAAAVRLARRAGYTNAGTVEFLYEPATGQFAFLEVNTRLQVEHPVTELTTGLDLVKMQLHVAAGGRLDDFANADGTAPASAGYAIEARLNAEDAQRGFAPAPGTIETMTLPAGPGVRVDTGVAEGDVIPPEYDSMIAKVIASGRDRNEALARLRRALGQMTVIVSGGTTNKSFLLGLLAEPDVRAGTVDTGWLDRLTARGAHLPTGLGDVALVAASLDAADELAAIDRSRFLSWASRGRPQVDASLRKEVELRHGAIGYRVIVRRLAPERFAVELDEVHGVFERERLGRHRCRLMFAGRRHTIVSSIDGSEHLVEVDGVAHRFSRDDAGVVRAPAAALVVGVDVEPGDRVEAGERIAVVEAMKMEIGITAPVTGAVSEVYVARNMQVDPGAPLVRISVDRGQGDAGSGGRRLDIASLGAARSDASPVATVTAFLLGYDVDLAAARRAVAALGPPAGIDAQLLLWFADVCLLSPERREPDHQRAPREHLNHYLRSLDAEREGIPAWYVDALTRTVRHYGVRSLDRTDHLADALLRIFAALQRSADAVVVVGLLLERLLAAPPGDGTLSPALGDALDRLIEATQRRQPAIASMARAVRHRHVDRPIVERHRAEVLGEMRAHVVALVDGDRDRMAPLVACPLPLMPALTAEDLFGTIERPGVLIELLMRRYYRIRRLEQVAIAHRGRFEVVTGTYHHRDRTVDVAAVRCGPDELGDALRAVAAWGAADVGSGGRTAVVDVFVMWPPGDPPPPDVLATRLGEQVDAADVPRRVRRVAVIGCHADRGATEQFTFRRARGEGGRDQPYWMTPVPAAGSDRGERFTEDRKFRGLHPMIARRLHMWRLANFDIRRLPSGDDVYAFDCVARESPADHRLIAVAEVRDMTPVRDADGKAVALPELEHVLVGCLDAIRHALAADRDARRLEWNRVMLYVWPVVDLPLDEVNEIARRLAPLTEGLGLEQVMVTGRLLNDGASGPVEATMRLGNEPGRGLTARLTEVPTEPMRPLDDYLRRVIATRRRGLVFPYQLVPLLAGERGTFVEHDLDGDGSLVAVDRPWGDNSAGVVIGTATTPSEVGEMRRVVILGDPTRAMGSITEAECGRILAAIDLAAEHDLPVEWFALSAGAKIAMDSGSENLDSVARVLRRLVEHTQAGGEVNVVVAGINVGAQPYWNAEATMLMHTSGILVMTPDGAMVLTGKQAIDYSGGVSAEDNLGIGGYSRIMGPNGEAQYFAPTLAAAVELLHRHYRLTYRPPGGRRPPRTVTADPHDRDVRSSPHRADGSEFTTVGEIFSATANRDRKKPFDIRAVIDAVIDADHVSLERWPEMAEAETAVVVDARLGGHAVSVLGVESRPLPRHGPTPADGPEQWSAGTLFPLSSKKVARAINAASGNRPVVVLANLSGFDGSPESLRRLQLEYGAEIGRAIVNFDGPFVLCVVSRYHGGAFVVFSASLNDDMQVLAVEGSFASVIGGAPAAAVVFTREVDARTGADPRIRAAEEALAAAIATDVAVDADVRRAELAELREQVRTEKLGGVAAEFDAIHTVERAKAVGSVHRIISAARLRPELIAAIDRGIARIDARQAAAG